MNTTPARLLTEQELREWEMRRDFRRWRMEPCRCGHPRAEHIVGDQECAIHRADKGPECGCERFQAKEEGR